MSFRLLAQRLLDHLKSLEREVAELERQIEALRAARQVSRTLSEIPASGPVIATALVASIGDANASAVVSDCLHG